jgi:hypothetical protein
MTGRVYFRGSKREAIDVVNRVRMMLTGRIPDEMGVAASAFVAMGMAALSDIKADFVRKARHGVGEDGVKWQPLKQATLAYSRRFGPGEQKQLKAAHGLDRRHRFAPVGTGLLSAEQLQDWKGHYRSNLKWLATKHPLQDAKVIAAAIAWNRVKAAGGKTKLEVYGDRPHEILRDTGVLLNSLSPGEIGGGDGSIYTKPSTPGGPDQVFRVMGNGVIVGTNLIYAATHQYGDAKRGIPARPFLPKRTPPHWKRRWMRALSVALEAGLVRIMRGNHA